jgi:hypothetical protein
MDNTLRASSLQRNRSSLPATLLLTPSSRKTHRLLSLPLPPVPDTLGTVEFGKGLPSAVSAPSARAAPEGEIFFRKKTVDGSDAMWYPVTVNLGKVSLGSRITGARLAVRR